jgi:very-short-patch-repair endonuclease
MDWRDVACAQAGVVGRSQLLEVGVSEGALRGLTGRRELIVAAPGVYSLRGVPDCFDQQLWVAALWSGGVISHRSAGQLWDVPAQRTTTIHVTVDRPLHKAIANVRLHRIGASSTWVNFDGLRVTNRTATVVDLLRAERLPAARDLFDRSVQQGWISPAQLAAAVEDGRGLAGNAQLRRLVGGAEPGAAAESERVLHRVLKRAGLTGWQAQYRVRVANGFADIDVAFAEQKVAVEIDGRRYHDAKSGRFETDRARQNELIALGWRVLRFTWRMLTEDPVGVVAQIERILAV